MQIYINKHRLHRCLMYLNDQSVQRLKLLKPEAFEPSGESGEQNPGGS